MTSESKIPWLRVSAAAEAAIPAQTHERHCAIQMLRSARQRKVDSVYPETKKNESGYMTYKNKVFLAVSSSYCFANMTYNKKNASHVARLEIIKADNIKG